MQGRSGTAPTLRPGSYVLNREHTRLTPAVRCEMLRHTNTACITNSEDCAGVDPVLILDRKSDLTPKAVPVVTSALWV